jgi:ssDNA thymidine ADP-ribosyltransferase, DarT
LKQIRVARCGGRFVGEFVPFYFCPRSPMLFTTNKGATGQPAGCQRTILHLVSRVSVGISLGRAWAVSDGNAGAFHTWFDSTLDAIKTLDWEAIRATDWRGRDASEIGGVPRGGVISVGRHSCHRLPQQ